MQLSRGHDELRTQTAVAMNAEHLEPFAAVSTSRSACVTLLAVHVRLDRTSVADLHPHHILPDLHDLDAKLVPRNPRIAEKWHLPQIAGNIGAANTHPANPHQGLSRPRPRRLWNCGHLKTARLLQTNRVHAFVVKRRLQRVRDTITS